MMLQFHAQFAMLTIRLQGKKKKKKPSTGKRSKFAMEITERR